MAGISCVSFQHTYLLCPQHERGKLNKERGFARSEIYDRNKVVKKAGSGSRLGSETIEEGRDHLNFPRDAEFQSSQEL